MDAQGRKIVRRFLCVLVAVAVSISLVALPSALTGQFTDAAQDGRDSSGYSDGADSGTSHEAVSSEPSSPIESPASSESSSSSESPASSEPSPSSESPASSEPSPSSESQVSSEPSSSSESPVSSEPSSSSESPAPSKPSSSSESPASSEPSSSSESPASSEPSSSSESPVSSEPSSSDVSVPDEQPPLSGPDSNYTYEDKDIAVNAVLSDASALPEGAELRVVPIKSGKAYREAKEKISESVGNENRKITGFLAYDIYFEANGTRYEPEAGTAAVAIRYKGGLFDRKVKQATDEIRVLHLRETGGETKVEDVTETVDVAEVGGDKAKKSKTESETGSKDGGADTVEFVTDSFSTFVVAGLAAEDAGIQFSASDIMSRLSPVLPFGVFANKIYLKGHSETCIAAQEAYFDNGTIGNDGNNFLHCLSNKNTITVNKTYAGTTPKTFRFGLFDQSGSLVDVKTLMLPNGGEKSGTVVFEVDDDVTDYTVNELKSASDDNDSISEHETYDGFTLTRINHDEQPKDGFTMNRISYIEKITQGSSGWLQASTKPGYPNELIVGEGFYFDHSTSDPKAVFEGGGTLTINGDSLIRQASGQDPMIDFENVFDKMRTLSTELAQTFPADTATDTLVVKSYTADQLGTIGSDGRNITIEINNKQMLLINIDASNKTTFRIPEAVRDHLKVDDVSDGIEAKQINSDWNTLAPRIVVNVYTNDSSDKLYTGKITNAFLLGGTLLAPKARVETTDGGFNGRIVAEEVVQGNGEFHSSATGTTGDNITWTFENKEESSLGFTLPETGGAGTRVFYDAGLGILLFAAALTTVYRLSGTKAQKRKRRHHSRSE